MAANPEAKDILTELEHNLERLTSNVLETGTDDIPCAYQRHVVGVLGPLRLLVRRIAHVVVCYHEYNHA